MCNPNLLIIPLRKNEQEAAETALQQPCGRIREANNIQRRSISGPTQVPDARVDTIYDWIPGDKMIPVCYCLPEPVVKTKLHIST